MNGQTFAERYRHWHQSDSASVDLYSQYQALTVPVAVPAPVSAPVQSDSASVDLYSQYQALAVPVAVSAPVSAPASFLPDPAFQFPASQRPCGVTGPVLGHACANCQRCADRSAFLVIPDISMFDLDQRLAALVKPVRGVGPGKFRIIPSMLNQVHQARFFNFTSEGYRHVKGSV